jgi:RHS repeat-associated protein
LSIDKRGQKTLWEETRGERFDYDVTNQIKDVKYRADQVGAGNAVNPEKTQTYLYTADKLNRQSVTDDGVVTNYVSNPLGINQITQWKGQTIQYDGNFNFRSIAGWLYSYDADNHLTGLDTTTPRARFVYDGLGRCVKRTIDGVTTAITYDGWKPVIEWSALGSRDMDGQAERPSERARASQWSSSTQVAAWNVYGPGADEIVWRWQSGKGHLRYHSDRHGNVTALLDFSGNVVERYRYDVFGAPTILSANNTPLSTSAFGNRFMFQGREYFREIDLYDYRHRFYDPFIGRFIQTDPIRFDAGDMNLFRYCDDDPVDNTDPTGLTPQAATLWMFRKERCAPYGRNM